MANILQVYRYLLENEFHGYDSIYVDVDVRELVEILFGSGTIFIFSDFQVGKGTGLGARYKSNSLFIIQSSFLKMDTLCRAIIEFNIAESKIVSFPMEVTNWKYIFESYGITGFVEYNYLPIGFFPIDKDGNIMKICSESSKHLEIGMKLTDAKYRVVYIGDRNLDLSLVSDDSSEQLLIVFNRYHDILSAIDIRTSFQGYVYELFGPDVINELADNRLYYRIKHLDMVSAIVEIKTEGKRLQTFKSWLDDYYRQDDMSKNIIIECKDKLVHIKEKEQFERLVKIALEINQAFSSNPVLTKDQRYTLAYQKLIETHESIIAEIDELINIGYNVIKIFRLICIQSLMLNGISKKRLEELKRSVVQTYGIQHMLAFDNLMHLGLVTVKNVIKNSINILKNGNMPKKIQEIVKMYRLIKPSYRISVLFDGGATLDEIDAILSLDKMIKVYFNKLIYPNDFVYDCMKN